MRTYASSQGQYLFQSNEGQLRAHAVKSRDRKRLIYASLTLLMLFFAGFVATAWPRNQAHARALWRITQYCLSTGRNPLLLSAESGFRVRENAWEFELTYEGQPRYRYGVWISPGGKSQVYGPDPDDSRPAE